MRGRCLGRHMDCHWVKKNNAAEIGQEGTMSLQLAVENFDNLVGTGTDTAGAFAVKGTVVPTDLRFVKSYVTHTVEYTGESTDDGANYAGKWLIAETDSIEETWGDFTMKPPAPCVTAITSQSNYKPPAVKFNYTTVLLNGFGSFSPDTYQEKVCGASSLTSCDGVANTFTYKVEATYTFPDAASMTEQDCQNAIAAVNDVMPSSVTCSLTAERRVTADGRRLQAMTANAGIEMSDTTQAQAVAASVMDTNALKSAIGGSSKPTLVATTNKVTAETRIAVPDGSTDAVKGDLELNLANSLSGAIPGATASTIPVQIEIGAPTPPTPTPPATPTPSATPDSPATPTPPAPPTPSTTPDSPATPTPPATSTPPPTPTPSATPESDLASSPKAMLAALAILSSSVWAV